MEEIIKDGPNLKKWCNIQSVENGYKIEFYQKVFVAQDIKTLIKIIEKELIKF